jgi:saccharopine dehydrogenase (NAD+, L-lysine forming)
MSSPFPRIHLRLEQKIYEHRSFSPVVIGVLVAAGYPVTVEGNSSDPAYKRIFEDSEYESVGAKLVPAGTWPDVPPGAVILGLKDLPQGIFPLTNDHVMFGHCYKNQDGWQNVLSRFPRGGSTLYDIEFLTDENGRRVSAFGYFAGFAGAALAVKAWAWQLAHPNRLMPSVQSFTEGRGYYRNEDELVQQIREDIVAGEKICGRKLTAMVMGALGRCGRGACDLFIKSGLLDKNMTRWDINETKDRYGPYEEIVQHDIFVNCVSSASD